ncbi:MAG: hypothetical protein FWC18_05900, partial [Cystobacterineae bacterium]|nr:hypothetical protein [Cystobacterineae bacterium]
DEGGCGGDFCTGGGVVAVDIEALGVVKTIPSIGGMPTSLGFIPLTHQGVEVLVGFYITGRGLIGVFNAGVPGPLEAAKAVSVAFFSLNGEGELVEASYVEGPLRNEDGTPAVVVVGEVLDETILIGIEALLPGWIRTTLEADPAVAGRFWVGGDADMSRIRPGDLLEVFVGEALCTKLNVAGIDEGGGALELEGEFPACFSERTHFQLRAGSGSRQPYVVTGTQTGYMGRVGPKEAFEHTFSAGASINIGFGDGILSGAGQGARWELALASGYLGHSYDIQGVSPCSTRIAAGVWMDSVRKKAYISFSSSNALVEVGVKALLEGGLGEGEVACYR